MRERMFNTIKTQFLAILLSATILTQTVASMPDTPVCVAPDNGAKDIPTTPTLDWTDSPAAQSYDVFLTKTDILADFSPQLLSLTVNSGATVDFDNDGDLDIASYTSAYSDGKYSSVLYLHKRTDASSPSFQTIEIAAYDDNGIQYVKATDINADGRQDIIILLNQTSADY